MTNDQPASSRPIQLCCPICKKNVEWSDAFPERPFCSKRCKLIDLGDWASESHKIPVDPSIDDLMSGELDIAEQTIKH
ncbi:DNA gyrase inhibitor YacG [Simiduia curdlanivorans]|uniref:DNA gyrase inhibitor YacG n=1 Tax=Simiduia curdlanivorans TaxID=1492769 RepID=A0ABV8V8V7_9GAMM|nr:DNA gyrase inhibitor YacG [Simiduia curdlanivorans]MDN3638982.1 DNA gyrase inhibitor YacG [Simiduia curdlanivorans]